MDFITLPRFDWFCSDPDKPYTFNVYSGSAGTDGHEGCIKNLTFSYKIRITKEAAPRKRGARRLCDLRVHPRGLGCHKRLAQ